MASITTGIIEKIQIDSNAAQNIASTAYGVCATAENERAKTVEMTGFYLETGVTVHIKFNNDNTTTNPTLNINNTGAKSIVQYNDATSGITSNINEWQSGTILSLTYDGQYWVLNSSYKDTLQNDDITIANGDKLIVTDNSNGGKIARTSTEFDGVTTTQALTKKGTWETFNNYQHPTTSGNKHIPSGGSNGQILGWDNDGTAKWITITAADLGLSSIMHYRGITSTNVGAGQAITNATITINNNSVTAVDGDVVSYYADGAQYAAEYVWANNQWNLLGDEGSYKTKQSAVTTATDEDDVATRFVYSITQDTNGVIDVTTRQYILPLATNSIRGGVKIGYTQDGQNYPIALDNEKMYVTVPWTDTHLRLHKKTVTNNSTQFPLIAAIDDNNLNAPAFLNGATYEDVHGVIMSANTPTIDFQDGTITAAYFSGSGAKLTNLNASNITGGTINPHYALLGPESGANAAPTWRGITIGDLPVTDNSSARELENDDQHIPTIRTIYFGLPTINNAHDYTSTTTLFAPTSSGDAAGYPLISVGSNNAPVWYNSLILEKNLSTNTSTVTFANQIVMEYTPNNDARIYPNTNGTGIIGINGIYERRWKAGYFSDKINLSKVINSKTNEINLYIDSTTGSEISVKSLAPKIILEAIAATANDSSKTWQIKNDGNTFTINCAEAANNSHILSHNGTWNLYDNTIIYGSLEISNNLETKGYIYHNTNNNDNNNNGPMLWMNSTEDYDVLLISSSSSSSPNHANGYQLLYYGDSSNTTTHGQLQLIADNGNGLDIAAINVTQTGAVSLGGALSVAGTTTINNTLEVTNATTLRNTLDVYSDTTIGGTLDVTDATSLGDTLDVAEATSLGSTLDVTGATTLNSTLDVAGATNLSDTLDVLGATSLDDTLDVTGAVTLQSTLTAAGDITVTRLSDANNNDPGPGIWAENQTTSCKVGLYSIDTDGNHGVYSTGYFDGTNYNIDGRWLIFRSEDNRTYTSQLTSDVLYLGSTVTDLTDTANGTTNSETLYHSIWGQDVNKYSWFCVEGYASPDGSVSAFLGVRNCATDGTPQSWKGLTITQQKGSDATSFSISGQFIAELIPSSWINGQRYNNAAYNIADYDNAGSYNPWMRATNTWSSGEEDAKVGRWFSFGTCGSSFYWLGSTTTRTENGVDQSMDFDISSGDLTVSHSIKSSTGSITAPEGNIWAGTNDDTTAQREVGVQSGSGRMFMYSTASDTGNRGIYLPAHGTGGARNLFVVGTNNEISFADGYNGAQTKLAYSQAGLAASAITWLTCWNGYELRAISKAEMANAVDSAHKWVRIGGDTMTGQLYINLDQDVGLNQSGSLVIGTKTGSNIGIDGNEIMARSNSAASTLYINSEGGLVYIGSGQLQVNSTITSSNGYLKSTCNSNTVTIGSQNSGFCHIYNSADIPFIFNKQVQSMSSFKIYNTNTYLSNNYLVFAQGGGWYMSDTTWIRSYGSKSVYVNTGDLRCDGSTWGGKCRLTNDWLGFYSGNGGGTRYGFLEVTSTKYYFRKENGADSYPFDFNGNIMFNGSLKATAGNINLYNTNGYNLAVQNDGNLVLYNSNGTSRWSSKTATSSYLVKQNIMPLDKHEIDNLKKLNVIRFNYRPEMKEGDTSRRYGLIAEEVLPLFPDIVDVPENYDASKFDITKGPNQPILGIKYERFIPILIKAVQVQDKEIQQLKSEIQYLKNRR